ncbi:hypothetical protein RDWZM_000520 [Blomia tropicalis]|uniref:Elongation factor 1-delta n=1 Tax=Blomia tropicalis TaxID=40697 RepID=A0A9Q0MDX5_BLOTA|nr:hypothetical protein RDWZM_000520 [Blomia tropicalis]
MAVESLLNESEAINNYRYRLVESQYLQGGASTVSGNRSTVGDGTSRANDERVQKLESKVSQLEETINNLRILVEQLKLNIQSTLTANSSAKPAAPTPATKKVPAPADDDDDDVDLFGSDDDDNAAADELREKRLAEYAAKKSKKPGVIAKSSVIFDVKPWDDETDMEEMQRLVRTIEMDGLVWGASKLVPLAYGIKKLQIICVIEDEKVSTEELSEKIEGFEDFVQSVDIAAFNKI